MKIIHIIILALFVTDTGICLGVDQSICNPGSTVDYYPNGQLRACSLKDNYISGDIFCNQYSPIRFYNSGNLETCTLSRQIEIDGTTCKGMEPVSLFETGKLRSCSKPN